PRRVAEWVSELAADALASRSRLLSQVETWDDGAGDIPLSSTPFAAEIPMVRTPTPPPPGDLTPALELRRRTSSKPPPADEEADDEGDERPPSANRALAVFVSIAAAVVLAYLATR